MSIQKPLVNAVLLTMALAGGATAQPLRPCADDELGEGVECGAIRVLEDRSDPSGRKIDLNVLVLRAHEPSGREPLFLLAGGPGQGATDLLGLARAVFEPVRQHRDLVMVDQRGTGRSNPLTCANGSRENPQVAFDGLFDPKNLEACLAEFRQRADVRLYSMPHVIADLEQVRGELGYERVVLWGGSGGTRTALVWMRSHPERVVAAALDGVAPTDSRAPSNMARFAQDALGRVFDDCAAQATCNEAFPALDDDFRKLLWTFEGGPVTTKITREDGTEVSVRMDRGGFAYALRGILYRSRRIATLPRLIHESAQTGDVSPFAQALWRRDVGLRPVVSMGVHFAAYCNEDVPFIESGELPRMTRDTFFGTWLVDQYRAVCGIWDSEPLSNDYLQPTRGDTPTLIFSGYYDPSTPESFGAAVASHLKNSRHVVVRNEGHGAGFGCGREATVRFLTEASLEGLGPICEETGPIEFEVPGPAGADAG